MWLHMVRTPVLADLGHQRFVSLTTFRRSGEPVPTPVWVLSDGVLTTRPLPSESTQTGVGTGSPERRKLVSETKRS